MILPFFRFFRFSGRTGSGNPDLWAFLESLGQARSVGTHIIPVGSLGEPQLRQTGKTVFPDLWAFLESSGQARSVGTPTIPVGAIGEPQMSKTSPNRKSGFKTG